MSNLREKMEIENKENMAHKNDSFIRRLGKLYLYRNKKKRVNSCINLRKAGNFFFFQSFQVFLTVILCTRDVVANGMCKGLCKMPV